MSEAKHTPSILSCPFCGGAGRMNKDYCPEGTGIFYSIKCGSCGAKSRAKYASIGNDCPQHYQEVRDGWNQREPKSDAAPEMYEALTAMLHRFEIYCGGPDNPYGGHTDGELLNLARSAVAKAEGTQTEQ